MRRLAAEMGVGTMSIYWYFPSKGAIFDAVVEAVLSGFRAPAASNQPWDERVARLFRQLRAQSLEHPGVAAIWSSGRLPGVMILNVTEYGLALMAEAGFGEFEAVQAYRSLLFHTLGMIQLQTDPWPHVQDSSALDRYSSALDELDPNAAPHMTRSLEHMAVFEWDLIFERGLSALIQALALSVGQQMVGWPLG